jgi:hypothetical protein
MLGILYDLGIAPDLLVKAIVLDKQNFEKLIQGLVRQLMYDLEYFQRKDLFDLRDDELRYYLKKFYDEIIFDRKTDLIMCEVERGIWVIIEVPSDFVFVAEKYYGGVRDFFEYFASDIEDKSVYRNVDIDRYEFPFAVVWDRSSFSLLLEALANYLLFKKDNLEKYLVQFFTEIIREAKVDGMICEIDREKWVFFRSAKEFISFIKKFYGSIENFVEEESRGVLFY